MSRYKVTITVEIESAENEDDAYGQALDIVQDQEGQQELDMTAEELPE